jgi:hypothetical protein
MNDYFICGLHVRSSHPLPYATLRTEGEPDIVVENGKVPEIAAGNGTSPATFAERDGTIVLAVEGLGRLSASAGRTITVDVREDAAPEDIQLYVAGAMLGAIWQQRGIFPLHASGLDFEGGVVAIAGRTGAGKSTIAAFLAGRGHDLVSDDMCVLTTLASGEIATWPGPARVKLGEDGLRRLGIDRAGLGGAGGTRAKYHLPVPSAETRQPRPLRRIYLLAAGEGTPRVERLAGLAAIDAVAGHCYAPEFAQALGLEQAWLKSSVEVARLVPVRRLVRPMGYQHMEHVLDVLEADVLQD